MSYLLAMIHAARCNEMGPEKDAGQVSPEQFMAHLGGKIETIEIGKGK